MQMDERFADELRAALVAEAGRKRTRHARRAWFAGGAVVVGVLGGSSVATGVPIPIGGIADPADKPGSAAVDPVERAEHDSILDLPLADEIQSVEQALSQLGVFGEFPDVFGATEVNYDTAELLVYYNEAAAPERVATFLARVDAVSAPAELGIVAVAAGYARAEREQVLRGLLMRAGELASQLQVSEISGGGIDHRTGQIVIHTTDDMGARTVTIGKESIRVVGSIGPAFTGSTPRSGMDSM